MTRKVAAEIVEKYIESFEGGASIWEALKMAADALKNEDTVIDEVLEIIDKVAADYEAMPTEIDVGREKAVISFEKKDGMLAMASIIRVLVLGLSGEGGEQE